MKPNTAIKYSWFLILLSLGHEFTAAYRTNNHFKSFGQEQQSIMDSADPLGGMPFRPSYVDLDPQRNPEYFNGDYLLKTRDDYLDKSEKDDTDSTFVQPGKRGWAAVLAKTAGVILALSVGASVGGVAMEAWFKLAGCCKSGYSEICTMEKDIKKIQDYLIKTFDSIDRGSLMAKNLLEDITHINYKMRDIWNDLDRIHDLQDELLEELTLIKAFNTKWSEIEAQIKKLNDSYRGLTIAQLDTMFHSVFDSWQGTLLTVGGFALIGLQIVGSYAFNRYAKNQLVKKINKFKSGPQYEMLVNARHTKAARIMGVDKVGLNKFIENTVTNKQKSKFNAQRFATVLNVISILGGGLSIYFEVAAAIQRVQQCKDQKTNAENMLARGKKGKIQAAGVYKNITDYITYVQKSGFDYVKGELTGEPFLYELQNTLDLVQKAGTQTADLILSAKYINEFLENIRDADANKTREISGNLAQGLAKVKFLYSCYTHRERLVNYVKERCKNGTKSLKDLYADATKSFNTGGKVNSQTCKDSSNVSYYSLNDMQKEWDAIAKKTGLSSDCQINNPSNKEDACRKFNEEKKDYQQVADEMGLTPDQVKILVTNCPLPTLSPAKKEQVCKLRAKKWTDTEIAEFYSLDIKVIAAYTCPTTAAPGGR